MSNEENLIPLSERTKDEQREIAKKGGRASGKARRKKRTAQEAAQLIWGLPVNKDQDKILEEYGIEKCDRNYLMLIMVKAVQMASNGDLKAIEFIRDTLGENPKYKLYEKKIELLIADKEAVSSLADDWVNSIPDTPKEDAIE
ncbi:MAG: KGG domain-containing protein [Ruminococcus flavefaciens]|nr:KGG domain-containing protein [Ruminococcus flavefaciens]MCM1062246.1 KGG domain-containing protein [Eubacterium sp.]